MTSEKQFKYIEDKIAEAAGAADYPFTETSWKKMEALLDKKERRRRFFFWMGGILLLGLLLGGGIIYRQADKKEPLNSSVNQSETKDIQKQNSHPDNDVTSATPQQNVLKQNEEYNNATTAGDDINTGSDPVDRAQNNSPGTKKISDETTKQSPVNDFTPEIKLRSKKTGTVKSTADDNYAAANKNIIQDKNKFALKITAPQPASDNDKEAPETQAGMNAQVIETKEVMPGLTKSATTKPGEADMLKTDTVVKKTNTLTDGDNKKDKKNEKSKVIEGFFLTGTVGAEASSTKLLSLKNSSITPVYGVGVGYRFNKRISVQTGFYAAAKKYIAGPGDYKVKPGSYLSTVKIINVDANCLVYEIPLIVQYNWITRPKTNYFASAGISGYIMKKEKYNYTYERYNSIYSYPYDYTKNTHLLAALRLSAGVEKQLGRKLFIQAAPVINIPLQGVGEGQVRLFTTGLQVSLTYFPFKK